MLAHLVSHFGPFLALGTGELWQHKDNCAGQDGCYGDDRLHPASYKPSEMHPTSGEQRVAFQYGGRWWGGRFWLAENMQNYINVAKKLLSITEWTWKREILLMITSVQLNTM